MAQVEERSLQAVIAMSIAALTSYLNAVIVPITVLMIAMIIDYITGMVSAWHKSELSSQKGVFGIVKKVSYLALVCVGMGVSGPHCDRKQKKKKCCYDAVMSHKLSELQKGSYICTKELQYTHFL